VSPGGGQLEPGIQQTSPPSHVQTRRIKQMSVHKPEDWPSRIDENLNAADLDRVMALYSPIAVFVSESGEPIFGRERIRCVLSNLIGKKARFESHVIKSIVVGDTAVLYTDFHGTALNESGVPAAVQFHAIEVLARQSDGTWQLIMGDPNARK